MNLNELFLDELADMYDAEHRIAKALPKMAKAATDEKLSAAILAHLKETEGQITKLEQIFEAFGEKAKAKECKATVGLLKEGDEIAKDNKDEPTINAAIISACQKVEHYEIASYGCLHAWAMRIGNKTGAKLIREILDQEEAADKKLSALSATANDQAMEEDEETATIKDAKPSAKKK